MQKSLRFCNFENTKKLPRGRWRFDLRFVTVNQSIPYSPAPHTVQCIITHLKIMRLNFIIAAAAAGVSIIFIAVTLATKGWAKETGTSKGIYVVFEVGLFKTEATAPNYGFTLSIDCKRWKPAVHLLFPSTLPFSSKYLFWTVNKIWHTQTPHRHHMHCTYQYNY